MWNLRRLRADDEPCLRAKYLERFPNHGWLPMDDAVAALTAEDDGEPVLMVAAHAVAEVRMVIDPEWGTPALRQQAFLAAHDALHAELKALGYKRALTKLEPSIARAFGRRLNRLRGWVPSRFVTWVKEI